LKIFLLTSIIFFLCCDKVGMTNDPVWGCTDTSACNFSSGANRDDGSCFFPNELYDCAVNCLVEVDECGVCGGGGPIENFDCTGNCLVEFDECGVCGGNGIDDGECDCFENIEDCTGECGGDAVIDDCGICDGKNSSMDCFGICDGDAIKDELNNCCETLNECGLCSNIDLVNSSNIDTLFIDEFENGIDPSKWNFEEWHSGAFNHELQIYTSNSDNAFTEDDKLIIRALRENSQLDSTINNQNLSQYTSARLTTRYKVDFKPINCGTCGGGEIIVEVKAKLPHGVGTWPAIWMLPTYDVYGGWPASGEIDIMEHAPGTTGLNNILSSLHTNAFYGGNANQNQGGSAVISSVTDDFFIYRLNWSTTQMTVEVQDSNDNEVSYETLNETKNSTDSDYWPFDQEFFIILNLAIGGDMGGDIIDNNVFPQQLEIEYVKVYQQGCYE